VHEVQSVSPVYLPWDIRWSGNAERYGAAEVRQMRESEAGMSDNELFAIRDKGFDAAEKLIAAWKDRALAAEKELAETVNRLQGELEEEAGENSRHLRDAVWAERRVSELKSKLTNLARRIGVAADPQWVREELERIINAI
jgi:hypothetical protein